MGQYRLLMKLFCIRQTKHKQNHGTYVSLHYRLKDYG